MAQTIVLILLLAWLVTTAIMTLTAGWTARERPRHRAPRQTNPPPPTASGPDFQDHALASRP